MLLQRGAFAFTNELSTFAGYEMLKYVSFPVQVMAKSVKMLPNMMMGRIVSLLNRGFWDFLDRLYVLEGWRPDLFVWFWTDRPRQRLTVVLLLVSNDLKFFLLFFLLRSWGEWNSLLLFSIWPSDCCINMCGHHACLRRGCSSGVWLIQVAVSSISCLHTRFWNSFPVWEID